MITYRKFNSQEEAFTLINILESGGINYQIENISPTVDLTFTGGNPLEYKIAVKIKSDDFEKVDHLLEKIADESINLIDEDHYLFEFANSELIEIIEKFDEWSKTDYLMAQKILKERGNELSIDEIQKFRDQRIEKLRKPEKGHKGWLVFGFICAILGGLLGIFIGYHHFQFKKRIPTGERVYAYDLQTRKTGAIMFLIGMIATILLIVAWVTNWI